MNDLGVFIVAAALTVLIGLLFIVALMPTVQHWKWERRQARRRRRYL